MKQKIYIRSDGNELIGLGHIVRCNALGQMLKNDFSIHFFCKDIPDAEAIKINNSGFKLTVISEEEDFLSILKSNIIVLLDHYKLDSAYQKNIKEIGCKLICIDDLHDKEFYADLIINHAPGIKASDYQAQPYTQFALGTNYAMLRPAFLEAAKEDCIINKTDTAFVCFGGADILDLSIKATRALVKIRQIKEIHVVLGGSYKHRDIYNLEKEYEHIHLHRDLGDISLVKLMKKCQLGIVPSSSILYELCAVKMIVLSGYFVSNQKKIYEALSKKSAICTGGNFAEYTENDFYNKIIKILKEERLDLYLQAQRKLIDGKSSQRFLYLFLGLTIEFAKATAEDMMLVYNWSNDSSVRENSYNSAKISLNTHSAWFSNKIKDKNTLFFIAHFNNEPAGLVRYSIEKEQAQVGILIANEFRGKKLAPIFLKKSAELFFNSSDLPILANIKEFNSASIKSFESAGYSFYKKKIINNINSLVYKLEKNEQ